MTPTISHRTHGPVLAGSQLTWRSSLTLLLSIATGCGGTGPIQPASSAIARIEIATDALGLISVPLRGTTPVTVLARNADSRVVSNAPTATLVSRDTTVLIVEPGLIVRSVAGGSTMIVATMVVGDRTLRDSARVGVVVPLGAPPR
jgi:hypothetical protein